jgi:hypothetical protein
MYWCFHGCLLWSHRGVAAEDFDVDSTMTLNKADAPNPALESLFQNGRRRRGVGDLRRSANT